MERVTVTLTEEQVDALDNDPECNSRSESARRHIRIARQAEQSQLADDLDDVREELTTLRDELQEVRDAQQQGLLAGLLSS